jgi:hypothetical protein
MEDEMLTRLLSIIREQKVKELALMGSDESLPEDECLSLKRIREIVRSPETFSLVEKIHVFNCQLCKRLISHLKRTAG